MSTAWERLARLGQVQAGLVATWQAEILGVQRARLARQVDGRGWVRVFRGCYALPGAVPGIEQTMMGGLLAAAGPEVRTAWRRHAEAGWCVRAMSGARPDALVTGAAALWLAGVLQRPPAGVRLLVGADRRPHAGHDVTFLRSASFDRYPVIRPRGWPAAAPAWALLDFAATHSDAETARTASRMCAKLHTEIDEIALARAVRGRVAGSAQTGRVLNGLRGQRVASATERRLREACRALGLEPVAHPLPITHEGRIVGEADIPFLPERLDVEVDGPHHFLPVQAATDRVRDRRLQRAGWTVRRYSVYDVDADPIGVAREILADLQELRARLQS